MDTTTEQAGALTQLVETMHLLDVAGITEDVQASYDRYCGPRVLVWATSAEQLADRVRAVTRIVGKLEKEESDNGLILVGAHGDVAVKVKPYSFANVCERVQVGVRTVEEPVFEWRCPDSVLRPDPRTGGRLMPLLANVVMVVGLALGAFVVLCLATFMPDRLFLAIDRLLGGRHDAHGVCICGTCIDCRNRYPNQTERRGLHASEEPRLSNLER